MVVEGRDLMVVTLKAHAQHVLQRLLRPVRRIVSAELVEDQRVTGDILSELLGSRRCAEGNACLAQELALRIERSEAQLYQVGATRGDILQRATRVRALFDVMLNEPDPVELLTALEDALYLAEEGWSYADEYFQKKWEFKQRLATLRAVVQDAKEKLQ
jgi:hypothetical protein